MLAVPAVSGSSPSIAFKSVDLPAPFAPSSATNSPRAMLSDSSRQIVRPPSRTDASRMSTACAAAVGRCAAAGRCATIARAKIS